MQIPVEGGHQGGRLNVYSPSKSFDIGIERDESDRQFHLTAFYPDCQIEMQPVKKGFMVTLEFNLMSSKFLTLGPLSLVLPKLFPALEQVKEALTSWKDWRLQIENEEQPNEVAGK